LERKALFYVRQSSAHQVLHNRESSALQYAMRDRLTESARTITVLASQRLLMLRFLAGPPKNLTEIGLYEWSPESATLQLEIT
jgi:hypothetical protein